MSSISRDPRYNTWIGMIHRCHRPTSPSYPLYGARGIRVCERWHSTENFFQDMGPRPSKNHSLDRINNDGNYEPGNCRWATAKEQANNTRHNVHLELSGVKQTIGEWAKKLGMDSRTIRERLNRGWSVERALTESIHAEKRKKAKKIYDALDEKRATIEAVT